MNRFLPSIAVLFLFLFSPLFRSSLEAAVPAITANRDFNVDTVVAGRDLETPKSLAFAERDNAVFFLTEKNSGRVRIIERGRLNPHPFASLRVSSSGGRGVLGVAAHPSYPDSPFVYVLYNRLGDRSNLVVRFQDSSAIGVHPKTLLVIPRVRGEAHLTGGKLRFGTDGTLFVLLYEYGGTVAGQDSIPEKDQYGRILRINADGSIPEDNPRQGDPVWSYGHRVPFDFCLDPQTGELLCTADGNDLSDEALEESEGLLRHVHVLHDLPDDAEGASHHDQVSGMIAYTGDAFPRLRGKFLVAYKNSPSLRVFTRNAAADTIVFDENQTFSGDAGGYSEIAAGFDGSIYLIGDPVGTVYKLRPRPPQFLSEPSSLATQGVRYSYTPVFLGTPPAISLISGPEGMVIDTTDWTLSWNPTNEQALEGKQHVEIRATNGAGAVDQSFEVSVANVNDPPSPARLLSPERDTTFSGLSGGEPSVMFSWEASEDIDGDTLTYAIQIDSSETFDSPLRHSIPVGSRFEAVVPFERTSRSYYWRVVVSDGEAEVASVESRKLSLVFLTTGRKEEKHEKAESVLEQNFPNPFNPSTAIKYTIPKAGHVHLGVYNMLGQELKVIFDGLQESGTYEFHFDGAELPSGIYFYRINAPDFIETRKMVIAK